MCVLSVCVSRCQQGFPVLQSLHHSPAVSAMSLTRKDNCRLPASIPSSLSVWVWVWVCVQECKSVQLNISVLILTHVLFLFVMTFDEQKKKLKDSPLPVSPSMLSSPITDGPVALSLSPVRKSQPKAKPKAREVSRKMDPSHYQYKCNHPWKVRTMSAVLTLLSCSLSSTHMLCKKHVKTYKDDMC